MVLGQLVVEGDGRVGTLRLFYFVYLFHYFEPAVEFFNLNG